MAGELVPLVMIPRFTTYVGASEYLTVPLVVSSYQSVKITVWRGKLVGAPGTGASLNVIFQTSNDAEVWTDVSMSAITTADASELVEFAMKERWLRVRLVLTEDTDSVVALTLWAVGFLEVREQN